MLTVDLESPKHISLLLLPTSLHPVTSLSSLSLLLSTPPAFPPSPSTFFYSPVLLPLWWNLIFSPFLTLIPSPLLLVYIFSSSRYPEESSGLPSSTTGSFHHGPSPQWAELVQNLNSGPPRCSCRLLRSDVLCHGRRRWRYRLSLSAGFPLLLQGAPGLTLPEAAVQGSTG